jgi:flagellin
MSTVINTNVQSLIAANALKVNGRAMSQAMQQLATGQRINSASDDAAGLAIGQSMGGQIRSLNMAVRNANDGISMAQTAEGALIEVSNMLQRMRELAVQASTGTLSSTQRGYLDDEFQALNDQIQNTVTNTKWNGISVLGSSVMTSSGGIDIQVGTDSGQTISVVGASLGDIATSNFSGGITSASAASGMLSTLDDALVAVNTARASLGAVVNQLTSAADNLTNVSQNLSESRSRVLDTDYAAATTELARTMIIQQAGTAVLAQANQSPQFVLALLR